MSEKLNRPVVVAQIRSVAPFCWMGHGRSSYKDTQLLSESDGRGRVRRQIQMRQPGHTLNIRLLTIQTAN